MNGLQTSVLTTLLKYVSIIKQYPSVFNSYASAHTRARVVKRWHRACRVNYGENYTLGHSLVNDCPIDIDEHCIQHSILIMKSNGLNEIMLQKRRRWLALPRSDKQAIMHQSVCVHHTQRQLIPAPSESDHCITSAKKTIWR